METRNTERKPDVSPIDNEELKDVVGGKKVIMSHGTCNKQCKVCNHRTVHQLNRFGGWECIICGTINI